MVCFMVVTSPVWAECDTTSCDCDESVVTCGGYGSDGSYNPDQQVCTHGGDCGNPGSWSCCSGGSDPPACSEGGPYYGSWGSCSGSPARKSRTVSYDCEGSSTEYTNCYGWIGDPTIPPPSPTPTITIETPTTTPGGLTPTPSGGAIPTPTVGFAGGSRGGMRAVKVSKNTNSCVSVRASYDGISGTTFSFTPSSASNPAPKNQTGATYVQFPNLRGGTYTIIANTHNASYVPKLYCYASSTRGSGISPSLSWNLSVPTDGEKISWDLAYVFGSAWTQVAGGGDVYAAGNLISPLPEVVPRYFSLDGLGAFPGIVTRGGVYDLDFDSVSTGGQLVSSQRWLGQDVLPTIDLYRVFLGQLGGEPATWDYNNPGPLTQLPARKNPYYIKGNLVTSGNWLVNSPDPLIIVVEGNLTLGGKINLSGNSFAAFVVKGDLNIDSSVGTDNLSPTASPVIEGVYVAGGTISTGLSVVSGKERLVARGSFLANDFNLQRDLDAILENGSTPAELWIYDPKLLIGMPDSLRAAAYRWEEVAP